MTKRALIIALLAGLLGLAHTRSPSRRLRLLR